MSVSRFAKNIRIVKNEQGLSNRQLASMIEVHHKTVGRILANTSPTSSFKPMSATVEKIAAALSIDVDTLMKHKITTLA
jgi:transcriptional regulator with XRE-family HTH domain